MSLSPFHLAIPVHDLPATRRFYGEVFGLQEGPWPPSNLRSLVPPDLVPSAASGAGECQNTRRNKIGKIALCGGRAGPATADSLLSG
jgi:hypothetical protein